MVTFTEEILNGKLRFCAGNAYQQRLCRKFQKVLPSFTISADAFKCLLIVILRTRFKTPVSMSFEKMVTESLGNKMALLVKYKYFVWYLEVIKFHFVVKREFELKVK